MDYDDGESWEWVIGHYSGEQARSKKAHADIGIGYYVRSEQGKSAMNYHIEVAFRRIIDGPRPEHLILAVGEQVKKLDRLYNQRHNINDVPEPNRNSSYNSDNNSQLVTIMRKSGLKAAYANVLADKSSSG